MSVPNATILSMNTTNGTKYTFVCDPDECDSLIELTTVEGFGFPNGEVKLTCPCGKNMSYLGATILSSQTEKEKPNMETTMNNLPLSDAEKYNPSLLVTYKKVAGTFASPEAPEYVTKKVTDIEWELNQGRVSQRKELENQNKVNKLENILSSYCQEATDPDMELIGEIAELFDVRLTKDISFTGTMSFSGTITVDLTEQFDLEDLINENLTVDAYSGDIEISDYSVEDVREDY